MKYYYGAFDHYLDHAIMSVAEYGFTAQEAEIALRFLEKFGYCVEVLKTEHGQRMRLIKRENFLYPYEAPWGRDSRETA